MELVANALVVLGAAVFLVAAVGLITLFDPYTRTSAVATAAGLGVSLVVTGVVLLDPTLSTTVKAVVAIVLQLATSAIGGMAIARSAVLSGHSFEPGTDTTALDALDDE